MKSAISLISVLSLAVLFNSCSQGECCDDFVGAIDFFIQDSSGNDLLFNRYEHDSIRLFFEIGGIAEEVKYDKTRDDYMHGKPFRITCYEDSTCLFHVDVNMEREEGSSVTFVRFNHSEMDTILCKWESGDKYTRISEVYYNGEFVYPKGDSLSFYHGRFIVVK